MQREGSAKRKMFPKPKLRDYKQDEDREEVRTLSLYGITLSWEIGRNRSRQRPSIPKKKKKSLGRRKKIKRRLGLEDPLHWGSTGSFAIREINRERQ